jgi:hypothetical protein
MSRIPGTLVFACLALAACVTQPRPQLTPVGDVIPAGVSLAGRWQLQAEKDDAERRIRAAEHKSSGGLEDVVAPARRDRSRNRRGADGPSVYVFLRTGSKLKVTQTPYALFISFDRSVVEEYRFREHRLINVGPIEADRASGWQDGRYVIQTLDSEGALLQETYTLDAGGEALVRTVSVVYDDEEILSLRQAFDRLD